MSHRQILLAAAAGATVLLAGPAFADKMKAALDGASEVPANTTPGKGNADIDFVPATRKLSGKLSYPGLPGPATMAHFHGPAEPGKNAGVAVPITPATSGAEGNA